MFKLDENEVIRVLTRNAIKCLVCNTVLESKHRHDFVDVEDGYVKQLY